MARYRENFEALTQQLRKHRPTDQARRAQYNHAADRCGTHFCPRRKTAKGSFTTKCAQTPSVTKARSGHACRAA